MGKTVWFIGALYTVSQIFEYLELKNSVPQTLLWKTKETIKIFVLEFQDKKKNKKQLATGEPQILDFERDPMHGCIEGKKKLLN